MCLKYVQYPIFIEIICVFVLILYMIKCSYILYGGAMLKGTFLFFCIFLFFFTLVGCQDNGSSESKLAFVEVKILVPEQLKVAEESLLQVQISQGKEKVNDADNLEFENWKEGQEKHEKIKAKNTADGIYSIDKVFQDPGDYTIITHVTARSMHTMPKKQFTVK